MRPATGELTPASPESHQAFALQRLAAAMERVVPDAPAPSVMVLREPFVVLGDGRIGAAEEVLAHRLSIGATAFGIAQARAFAVTCERDGLARAIAADAAAFDAQVCAVVCAEEYL